MLKRILLGVLSLIVFGFCYYLTDSVILSFILFFGIVIYGLIEFGIPLSKKERARRAKGLNDEFKKKHEKHRKNNSTI